MQTCVHTPTSPSSPPPMHTYTHTCTHLHHMLQLVIGIRVTGLHNAVNGLNWDDLQYRGTQKRYYSCTYLIDCITCTRGIHHLCTSQHAAGNTTPTNCPSTGSSPQLCMYARWLLGRTPSHVPIISVTCMNLVHSSLTPAISRMSSPVTSSSFFNLAALCRVVIA